MRMEGSCARSSGSASTARSSVSAGRLTRPWSAWPHSFETRINGRAAVPRLWHVRKQGKVLGPFPTGAIIADRLVGRISPGDELSSDGEEWRAFDAWPELTAPPSSAPSASADAEPQWLRERARARLRWVDERGTSQRRIDEDAPVSKERRTVEPERRSQDNRAGGRRTSSRPRGIIVKDRTILKILLAIAIAAGAIAWLAWLYGPVNPVPVHIR